jgi:drug/metabolite transporter (DMT)-like permease
LTRAFASAPLTATQPYAFLQLVWAMLFGFLLFGEVPDVWVCTGGFIIVVAISYLTHREAVAAKEARIRVGDSGKSIAS